MAASSGSQNGMAILSGKKKVCIKQFIYIFVSVLLVVMVIKVYDSGIRLDEQSTRLDQSIKIRTNATGESKHRITVLKKTKVLLMTYMRGGSSLLGEMINQNPKAVYWFEPFDGVFSELYGSRHGWFPIDLLYTDNEHLRLFTDYEEDALNNLLTNLISCNITALPTDTIAHYAMVNIIQKRFVPYVDCLKQVNSGKTISGKVVPPWQCKANLTKYCPRRFSTSDKRLTTCVYCLHAHPASPYRDLNISLHRNGKDFVPDCEQTSAAYEAYANCMRSYRKAIEGCTPLLEEVCGASGLVAIKAIRLRADLVQRMMLANPDLKVVHEIRDPRGIVLSRRSTGLLSETSRKNITHEASLLCQRIAYDLSIIRNIEAEFPGRILRIKYEDLALQPEQTTSAFYQFLDLDVPDEVVSYLTNSVSAEVQGNAYSTMRKNGTESVFKWQTKLTDDQIRAINEVCLDILERYSYPIQVE